MTNQAGFTLIESLIAMAIFTIGILGLFGMQTAAIKENLAANNITTGSTWAVDQVEQLINLPYNDPAGQLNDTDGDGCNGLDDYVTGTGTSQDADHFILGSTISTTPPFYNVYWNVAQDCVLSNIPASTLPEEDQRPKYIRIIVTRDNGNGIEQQSAIFNYIKQNVINP